MGRRLKYAPLSTISQVLMLFIFIGIIVVIVVIIVIVVAIDVVCHLVILLGGPVEKMSFFQMAPGSILSTQIPSDRSQYDVYKVLSKKIGWKVSIGGVKVDIFAEVGLVIGFLTVLE